MRTAQNQDRDKANGEGRSHASPKDQSANGLSREELAAARRFKEKLNEVGWNQTEAAEKLGISRVHVNSICGLRSSPSPHLLRLLEMEVADFNRNSPVAKQVDQEFESIRKALNRFPPEKRGKIARRVSSLLEAF